MRLFRFLKPISSAPVARERLQILLEYERRMVSQTSLISTLKDEILAVVSRARDAGAAARNVSNVMGTKLNTGKEASTPVEFARYFLRLANLPNFALDRLSRYETALWRQVSRILFTLEALDRRKPQERCRTFWQAGPQNLSNFQGE